MDEVYYFELGILVWILILIIITENGKEEKLGWYGLFYIFEYLLCWKLIRIFVLILDRFENKDDGYFSVWNVGKGYWFLFNVF